MKRVKITKSGKILARKSGQSHFNAKERHGSKSAKGHGVTLHISNKSRSRFITK